MVGSDKTRKAEDNLGRAFFVGQSVSQRRERQEKKRMEISEENKRKNIQTFHISKWCGSSIVD
jgi:hypothetical protein